MEALYRSISSSLPTPTALVITLPLLLLPLVFRLLGRKTKYVNGKSLHLPPGPPGWPVAGNLFQVALSGKPFIHYVRDLIGCYGPILTLRMGSRTLIIVGNSELAHEALVKRGQLFASRPAENPTRTIFSCNKFTVNSAVYGSVWRSLRRNMVSGMLSAKRIRDFRHYRNRAMDLYVERIRAEALQNGGAVSVLPNARFAVFCVLLAMCFGLDLDEETIVRVDHVLKKVLLILSPRIDDYLPILSPFFRKQRKEALRVRQEQIDTIAPLIEQRRSMLRKQQQLNQGGGGGGGGGGDEAPFSYLDSLLELRVDGRDSPPSEVELVSLCSEILNGGTDTTATAVEWGIARLLQNPTIQEKLHNEIVSTVKQGKKVDEMDTERMPYLQAFVKELLRKHPPTYFSLTHAALEDAELGGYLVPKGANLEFYLPAISDDHNLWKDADEFRPERFLGHDGEEADLTGVANARMLPFGAGRRICPGLALGVIHVSLIIARMVQEFEWSLHPSQPEVDLSEKLEFTVVMRRSLVASAKPRNPLHHPPIHA